MSLKHAILGFLSYAPLHGYELKKAFDNSADLFWHATQSQIYRTLAELDEEGLVVMDLVKRKDRLDIKRYTITPNGRAEFERWLASPLPQPEMHDPLLLRLFFGGRMREGELVDFLEREIQSTQDNLALYSELYELTMKQPARQTDERSFFLSMATLGYGIAGAKAQIRWLNNILARVEGHNYSIRKVADLTGEAQ